MSRQPVQLEAGEPGYIGNFMDVARACDRFLEARGLKLTREDFRAGHIQRARAVMRARASLNSPLTSQI